jgi:beta-lactam-binding protein with PASTA domain
VKLLSDDATEVEPTLPESGVLEPADATDTVVIASPDIAPEEPASGKAPGSVRAIVGRGCGVFLLLLAAVAAGTTMVAGIGTWVADHRTTTVPSVTGLRVPDATAQLAAAELTRARMGAFATTDFQRDVVMQQEPTFDAEVPPGTPVDLLVAVSPTPTVVPDVSLDTTALAEFTLGRTLLRPVYYQQLSETVDFGRVVSQMPRAGERVMTGQQIALFVSIGRGTGGAVVPSVLGKTVDEAAASIANVFLVAVLFDAHSGASADGKVTDQVPAPGTRVPIGSAVPLITTGMVN